MFLAFVHIEKTGGTTLNQVLRRNFLCRFIDVRPLSCQSGRRFTATDFEKYRQINPFLTAISGHAISPVNSLGIEYPEVRFITLLRDPAKRYVSQYLYFVRIGERQSGFERFLEQEEFSNFQTKKLAGNDDAAVAISVLESMQVSGAIEEFDSFLLRLRRSLEPLVFDPRYVIKNANESCMAAELLDRFRSEIEERNAKDRMLYQHLIGKAIPRANSQYEGDMRKELMEFAQQNARFRFGFRDYVDFAARKLYFEPVSGVLRKYGGLEARGSY